MKIRALFHIPGLCGAILALAAGCGGKAAPARGELRVLIHGAPETRLPRSGPGPDRERELAEEFAAARNLKAVFIPVADFSDLIPALETGKGDLIAANLTVLESRAGRVAFTDPFATSTELVVSRASEPPVRELKNLSGRTIAVQEGTAFMETARYLQSKFDGVKVKILPGNLGSDEILDLVARGEEDLTIEDSNLLETVLAYRKDIVSGVRVSNPTGIAWAVATDRPELLAELNEFLRKKPSFAPGRQAYREDLAGIKKRGVLRVLTVNTGATYFLHRGELLGFEYELARKFAQSLNLEMEVVVVGEFSDLIKQLLEGKGDLIAANLTPTESRKGMGIAFSAPYARVREVVVSRPGNAPREISELAGRSLAVRPDSSYRESLEKLRREGIALKIVPVPSGMATEEIIAAVAAGTYDLTVADSNILALELAWGVEVAEAFALPGEEIPHCWAVRKEDTGLLKAVDSFIRDTYRGEFYNLLYRKYFQDRRRARQLRGETESAKSGQISPYDSWVREYAGRYGFDWILIAAQMFQESRFDPQAVSWAGAKGLMQVTEQAARQVGLSPLEDPRTNLHAGVKYLAWSRDQFGRDLTDEERTWFALAAYNAGVGHVRDARSLAEKKGWDPKRWFDHAEKAILLLEKPEYAAQARHGYVRGRETAGYVNRIRELWRAYRALVP